MRHGMGGAPMLGGLVILAAFLVFASGSGRAQGDADLAALPTSEVVAAAESTATTFRDLQAEIGPQRDDLRELRKQLSHLTVVRESNPLPPRPDMDTPPEDLAAATRMADQWARRAEAAETLETTARERLDVLEQIRKVTLSLAETGGALTRTAEALLPLISELNARVVAGELAPGRSLEILRNLPPWIDPGVYGEMTEEWARAARLADVDMARTRQEIADLKATVADDQALHLRATRWHRTAATRARLRDTYADQPTGEIQADFASQLAVFGAQYRDIARRIANADARADRVAQAMQAVEALTPPKVTPTEGANTGTALMARVRAARQAVALAEAVVAYRKARQQALADLNDQLASAQDAAVSLDNDIEPVLDQGLALQVLAEILREQDAGAQLPAEAEPGFVDDEVAYLTEADATMSERRASYDARRAAVEGQLKDNRQALTRAREDLARYQAELKREEGWTAYVDQLQALDNDALIAAFTKADDAFQDARNELRDIEHEAEAYAAAAREAGAAMQARVDPVSVALRTQARAFQDWLAQRNLRIEGAPAAPVEAQTGTQAPASGGDATGTAGGSTESTAVTEAWLAEIRELRDGLVVRRRTFLEQGKAQRTEIREDMAEAAQALDRMTERLAEIRDAARHAWAAAGVLRNRARQDRIAEADLPERVTEWRRRDHLTRIAEVDTAITNAREAIAIRLTAVDALENLADLIPGLNAWQGNLSTQAALLTSYIDLRRQYEAIGDPEKMDPLESQKLEAEVQARVAEDLGAYQALADYFTTEEVATLNELLNRYYQRLVVSERQMANLQDRQELLGRLIDRAEGSREMLSALRTEVAQVADAVNKRLTVNTALVRAALDPANARRLLSDATAETGVTLDASDIPTLPRTADENARRQARNDLIRGLRSDWALATGYQQWLADLDERIEPLGRIDEEVAAFQDLNARLEASRNDLQDAIARLKGYSPEDLDALLTEQDLGPEQRELLALGEIGQLQARRQDLLESNAVRSAIALVIIPAIALIVILIARLSGRRAIHRIANRKSEEPGAVERAETLNNIFQTIITFLAIALAVIYMLEAVNVDVAPLIASLGIFGLAIAFGAQSTMKDIFGGFFLLLEKRLNVGDWVAVNSSYGVVESIGLRLTTVRGWADGGLTYINNGDISAVTNYNRGSKANSFAKGQKRNSFTGHIMVKVYTTNDADPEVVVDIMRRTAADLRAHPDYKDEIYDIWVEPGINDIIADNNSFEFRALLIGTGMIWAAGRVFRNKAVAALREAGIHLPQEHVRITDVPTVHLKSQGQ